MFIYHRIFQNSIGLFECFHCVFKLSPRKAYLGHDKQGFGHFGMDDFLVTFSGFLDDFLALCVIILSKSQLSQLVSDVHDFWGGFVLGVVQENVESFGEILFASLINLFAPLTIVRNGS